MGTLLDSPPTRRRSAARPRFASVPTGPHDPKIIAGYSPEMLDNACRELSKPNAGPWERERLAYFERERGSRTAEAAQIGKGQH